MRMQRMRATVAEHTSTAGRAADRRVVRDPARQSSRGALLSPDRDDPQRFLTDPELRHLSIAGLKSFTFRG